MLLSVLKWNHLLLGCAPSRQASTATGASTTTSSRVQLARMAASTSQGVAILD
jgi:uncharacterized protein YerC